MITTGTVINVVEHKSSFLEFEKDARQVEKVVTHAQKPVEKVVSHAQKVGVVLWRHHSHVAKRLSRMAKQFRSVQHDMRTEPHCTCDRRLECETRILNQEHVCCFLSPQNLTQ